MSESGVQLATMDEGSATGGSNNTGTINREPNDVLIRSRHASVAWIVLKKTFKTKRSKFMCLFVLVCLIAGVLALTVSARPTKKEDDPIIAFKERYFAFRTTLDRYSEPWTFALTNSAQRKAFQWLVFEDKTLGTNPVDETRLVQRYALMTLFYSCAGFDWVGDFALSPPLDQQVDTHECDFPTVQCNDEGFIVKFQPIASQLVGSLPDEISLLSHLTHLDLKLNDLQGTIPTSVFERMSNLESLVLDANRFGSTIATEFGSLSKLTRLELSSNSFTGTVPSTFKNLDFETLRLNLNPGLSGPILDFVDSWSNLKYFSIRSCAFTGTIPSTISGLTRLTHLSMGPDISGMLPSYIVKLTKLQELDIQGLRVGGTFPTQIHKMSNLQRLIFDTTSISGTIPKSIGALTNLSLFVAILSSLTGTLPSEFGRLPVLEQMFLTGSSGLTGTLPIELAEATNLQQIWVDGTSLVGTVPEGLCLVMVDYPCSLPCTCCPNECKKPIN